MKRPYLALLLTILFPCSLFAQTIKTVAGTGTRGFSGDGGPATTAKFSRPTGLAVDADRNIYVADGPNYRIRKITPNGYVTTIAGTGTAGYSGDGGPATAAKIGGLDTASAVVSLCIAVHNGNVYIADGAHHVIRMIDTAGIITTVAGTGTAGFSGDNGNATAAKLKYPQGISFDNSGNLYVADCYNHRIRRINDTGVITTIAGTGTAGFTGNGGAATAARLRFPYDANYDNASGNLYIADLENNCIRVIDTLGVIRTFAGTTVSGHTGDGGPATAALLDHPSVVRTDGMGNVYVSDNHNSYVRRINTLDTITAFAGTTVMGFNGDGGPATAARMMAPWGLAVDNDEFVFISDSANARIRRVALIAPITAPTSSVCSGATLALSDSTAGGAWSSNNASLATVSSSGVVSGIHPGTVIITYNTPFGKATRVITITGPTLTSPLQMPAVCSGDSILYTPTSSVFATTFTWQRSYVAGISALSTSGTGNIAEVLVNTTTNPKTITYNFTLTVPGCLNTERVSVSIRPQPYLSSTHTPSAICDSGVFYYLPTSYSAGTTFTWSRAVTPGITNPAATGTGSITEVLNSTIAAPVPVKYALVMTGSGMGACSSTDTITAIVDYCHPVSINPDPANGAGVVAIYPNPASQQFNVKYSGVIKDQMSVTLFDMTGKFLQSYNTGKTTVDISLAGFPAGLYYCQVVVDGQMTTKKLMVK